MSDQERLNEATQKLGDIIRAVDALAREAGKEAGVRCKAGENDLSADLRSIRSSLRIAEGHLDEAYAKGRRLQVPQAGGGVITPFSGGS